MEVYKLKPFLIKATFNLFFIEIPDFLCAILYLFGSFIWDLSFLIVLKCE